MRPCPQPPSTSPSLPSAPALIHRKKIKLLGKTSCSSTLRRADVANIDHYDVILGTLFLRHLGVALDFVGPGTIWMGVSTVPKNLLSGAMTPHLVQAAIEATGMMLGG